MFTLPGQTVAQRKQWTVMLYIAADHPNPDRAAITEQAAIRDIKELEQVGSTDDLNILVQIDRRWPGYPERYFIAKGHSEPCEPFGSLIGKKNIPRKRNSRSSNSNSSSGDSNSLKEFLDWARESYPADRAMLVLWGHAYGLGFGRDHGDPLTMPELASALETEKGYAIDILGANACAMCYAEAAYELRNAATFLVAPEITMPFAGWPYDTILKRIRRSSDVKPRALAQHIVTDFMESFDRRNVSLTMLDLTKAEPLADQVTALAHALDQGINRKKTRPPIAEAFMDTAHGEVRPLIDLLDLCERLADVDDDSIKEAADSTRAFLTSGEFVVDHESDPGFEGLHGLGIFAPAVTGAADLTRLELSEPSYNDLELVKHDENQWAKLVYKDLKKALDPMNKAVAEFVRSTGAAGVQQRTSVAQLVVSIHRSFVKLDRTVASAEEHVVGVIDGNGDATDVDTMNGVKPSTPSKFGSPYLRLTSDNGHYQFRQVQAPSDVIETTDYKQLLQTVAPLAALEDALSNVERTAKKVLTDRQFGLGEEDPFKGGLGEEDPFKGGLGEEDPFKGGLGEEDPFKGGLGEEDPFKGGLGLLPWLIAADSDSAAAANPIGTVVGLYRRVAQALQLSEEAMAKVEAAVRSVLTTDPMPQDAEYKQRAIEQVSRSFQELKETVAQAKRTTGSVLTHPAYGLGPTPQTTQSTVPRGQLAIAGGLSSRVLRLL